MDEAQERRKLQVMNRLRNLLVERGISEDGDSNKMCSSEGTNENKSWPGSYRSSRHGSLRGSSRGSFNGIEFDVEAGPVSDRDSEADQSSGISVDWVTQALHIRDRLLLQERLVEALHTESKNQEINPRERTPSPDYENHRNENPLEIPEPIAPKRGILKKDADTYELEKYRRNAMIIFNHQEFLGGTKPSRKGTLQDEETLKATFEMFGFDVEPHLDLPKKVLLEKLKSFCMKDFTQYGCVCAAVLTHGSKSGYLRAYDTRYSEHELIECFNVRRNPTLLGKPIIILIQACRGDNPATACSPDTPKLEDDVAMDNDPFDEHYNLPTECDMLIFHSSYIGRASARDPLKGSWFIQTLCKQIKLLAAATHFEGICMAVRHEIALEKEHNMIIDNKPAVAKQMPVMTSTLLRQLYLRKYCGCDNSDEDEEYENVHADCVYSNEMPQYEASRRRPEIDLQSVDVSCGCDTYFVYMKQCLRLFIRENPDDEVAQSILKITENVKNVKGNESVRRDMINLIRKYLIKNSYRFRFGEAMYLGPLCCCENSFRDREQKILCCAVM